MSSRLLDIKRRYGTYKTGRQFYFLNFITILCLSHLSSFANSNSTADTLIKEKIDSEIKLICKSGISVRRLKTADSAYVFNYQKKSGLLIAVTIQSRKSHDMIDYFFIGKEVVRAVFRPKKNVKGRYGAIYYFSEGNIVYKEEYKVRDVVKPNDILKIFSYYSSF